jgi:hypothetical protein
MHCLSAKPLDEPVRVGSFGPGKSLMARFIVSS